MKKLIFVIALITNMSIFAKANDYTLVQNGALQAQHNWEHAATAYALNTVLYSFGRKAFKMERREALIFGLISTFMISTVYSISNNQSPAGLATDMGMNCLGAGLSAGTMIMLEF